MARLINPTAVLGAGSVAAGDLFRAEEYRVPDYQRDFTWGSDELSKLWDDITRTRERAFPGGKLTSNPEPHFLGAIVTQQGVAGAPPEIIDGQQRLTTLSMLVSVLYEFASHIGDVNTRTNVTMQLLPLIANPHATGRDPRLVLAREQDFYNHSVVQNLTLADRQAYWATVSLAKRPVCQRIRDAVEFLHTCVKNDVDAAPDGNVRVTELVDVATELLMVLHLNVADHRMAYRVFETLNFRGLDLSQADLIKNELVRRSDQQNTRAGVVSDWEQVTRNLEKVSQVSLVEFLQFHYASKYDAVRASDLFESVVDLLDQQGIAARTYTQDLVDESARLGQVIEGDPAAWSASANEALEEIRDVLGLKFAYPLLMSAAARYTNSPADFDKWALRVRDFCFRYYTIGRSPLGAFTAAVTAAARKLRDVKVSDADVLADLQKASPDKVFEDRFSNASVSTNKLGFYIIKRIEDHLSAGSGKTFPQGPTQHLEHIMPKKPGSLWLHVSKDPRYDSYLQRIGNLLGLEQPINSHIKNKDYPYKVSNSTNLDYTHSKFSLPAGTGVFLNSSGEWDFESIEKRQAYLAAIYAVAVWPLT